MMKAFEIQIVHNRMKSFMDNPLPTLVVTFLLVELTFGLPDLYSRPLSSIGMTIVSLPFTLFLIFAWNFSLKCGIGFPSSSFVSLPKILYYLLVRYSFFIYFYYFFATWAEITKQPKNKQITFHRGDFIYNRFL